MMSRNFDLKLTPPPPSIAQKWVFYLHLHTECHKITYPPTPYLCDVIYEWSLRSIHLNKHNPIHKKLPINQGTSARHLSSSSPTGHWVIKFFGLQTIVYVGSGMV